jgi:two-component system sensor histidine kinase ArlS
MKIRTRLTLNFTSIVAVILIVFTSGIYYFSSLYVKDNFYTRLNNKAISQVKLFVDTRKIDYDLLRFIDSTTVSMLTDSRIFIYNDSNKLIYANRNSLVDNDNSDLIEKINKKGKVFFKNKNEYLVGFIHNNNDKKYIIIATAIDLEGPGELKDLRNILLFGLLISLILVIFAGIINSIQSLNPISNIIRQVNKINATRLSKRVKVENENDEIGVMAGTFNNMLDRIEKSFKTERDFVSNASHELRTPLTTINGEIEVALMKTRSTEEYQNTLQSIYSEIKDLTIIINGLLQLAESNIEETNLEISKLRIDDLIYQTKDDLLKQHPNYLINIEFDGLPDDETQITIQGNVYLLKILFKNLIDNACKFSENKKAFVKISFNDKYVIIKFDDNGIGIPEEDIVKIFNPLYRAENAKQTKGHGIGLSIVQKIILLHKGIISINSEVNVGTTLTIQLPYHLA